ncbi:MAG TPA: ABC transporter ATP-binding protein [Pirellulales bacterium]|nr:ABC transporter ATP-binding protein [Pirellulales bacterium]
MTEPIEAIEVSKVFSAAGGARREIRAVDGASLTIAAGNCWALTGPSGSGKSTLLALLGALDRPTAGEIRWGGRSLTKMSDIGLAGVRRRWGFLLQAFALLPRLSVWENVSYPLVPLGASRAKRLAAARLVLEPLGLAERQFDRAAVLSGGEQQRVALARALITTPDVLFADEPTNQLDERSADAVLDAFRTLLAAGRTLVVATHDPRLLALATHVGEMAAGQLTCR